MPRPHPDSQEQPSATGLHSPAMDPLRFFVNQREFVLPPGSPHLEGNLLTFLREHGFTGSKEVCGEGGCGACTVIVSRWESETKRVRHHSCVGCLVPLPSVHECQVITIEGVAATTTDAEHPISEAFHQLGASQCGYCTPGFIMTLLARLEEAALESDELERLFDGNLCRCTGYRPILDVAAAFCTDQGQVAGELDQRAAHWRERLQACTRIAALFPESYKHPPKSARLRGSQTTWFQPVALEELLPSKDEGAASRLHPLGQPGTNVRLIGGNTDLGYTERHEAAPPRHKVSLTRVRELSSIRWTDDGVEIGGGCSVHDVVLALEERIPQLPESQTSGLKALHNQCRFFANNQVRNVATVGGGIVNFSHYSDLIPVWVATAAELHFSSRSGSESFRLRDRYDDAGQLLFEPPAESVLTSITVPFSAPGRRVASFKYARRRMDSITFLSAGFSAQCDDNGVVSDPILCFDGTGTPGLRAAKTEALLADREWDPPSLQEALACLRDELDASISNRLPRPYQEHQLRLAQGMLLRFHARCQALVHGGIEPRDEQLLSRYPQVAHRSYLHYDRNEEGLLGRAIPHVHARLQTTGRAVYTADAQVPNCLHAVLVTSPAARGTLGAIDASSVEQSPDFVGLYTARDIPGQNVFGFRVQDEEVLASGRVDYSGQPVGVLVARTERAARRLAKRVQVNVEAESPLLTVESAEQAQSIHGKEGGYLLEQGDLASGFASAKVVVTGKVDVHGQAHFYLEPQNALVTPKDDGFDVLSSTQSPSNVIDHVSALLGIADNKVSVRVGRLGGGFGGKQFRAGPIAAICALASHHCGEPVKLVLDRDEDMAYCPGRSPFFATYRAGFGADGALCALDVDFKVSGGFSNDYSADITETATLLMDGAYCVENVRVHGLCLKTNYGSHTATRGFGKPQASAIIETIIDHGASVLGMPATAVRDRNLYRKGDKTITKMDIGDDVMRECWSRVLDKGEYDATLAEVEAFNRANKWFKRGIAAVGSKGNMGFLEADDINRGLATVQILRDGTVSVNHSGVEMGQGINTRMAQVAAHQLGIPLDRVAVSDTQSALIPNAPPTTMVATDLIGEAILKACNDLVGQLAKFSGDFEARVRDAYDQGTALSASASHTAPRLHYDYEKQQGDVSYFFVWGAALSVVEVDVISGAFRIVKSNVVQDCGKSLNPLLDVGQAEGGFLFGVGYYMMEDLIYSDEGRLITGNVSGYKIPSCGDVPMEWDIELLNYRPEGKGIHNSKGIGESNIQLGLSVYFAAKEAVRAARKEAGMSPEFQLGFPASVNNVTESLPPLAEYIRGR